MTLRALVNRTLPPLAALALLAPCVASGQQDWNAKEVTKLTRKLSDEVRAIKTGITRDWDGADKESARYVVLDDLMALHHQVVALDALVRQGQGRKQTAPVFRRVRSAVDHARRDAALFPAIEKQRKHIEAADATLERLEAYYEVELATLPPEEAGTPPPPMERHSPSPRVAAAAPDKTFRMHTDAPDPVTGCPESVMHDVSMNHGGNVRIWVHPEVTGRNEVTSTIGVIMSETGGHYARGELIERRVSRIPDLAPNCQIRRVLSESLAACEFDDDDREEDSHKCDIVDPEGLVASLSVSAQSPGLDFDCDDAPYNDAFAELGFNPIEVEVVCD